MRYSTQIDNVKSLEWGLNIQEAYVFSFLYSAPSWANEVILNGNVYYFVSRNLACKEIPLFTDKPDTMYRCYKSLEKKEVVKFIKIDGKDCVILTKKGKTWNTKIERESDYSENNPNKLGKLSETDSENNPTYKSTINNKSKEEEKNPSPSFVNNEREKAKEHSKNKTLYFKNEKEPAKAMGDYMVANIIPLVKGEMYYKLFTNYTGLKPKKRKELVEAFCLENCMKLDGWGTNKRDSNTDLLFHFSNWLKYRVTENENQTYKIPTT